MQRYLFGLSGAMATVYTRIFIWLIGIASVQEYRASDISIIIQQIIASLFIELSANFYL